MDLFVAGAALHQPTPPSHIFIAHLSGKDRIRIQLNITAYQEKEKNEKASKRGRRKKSPLISKRLRAALLRSIRGQHGKKMICVRGVPRVTETLRKTNRHFDPIPTGSGIALPR